MLTATLSRWRALRLVQQFTITASTLVIVGMLVIGLWVSNRIRSGVIESTALASAAHMEHHIAPFAREIAATQGRSAEAKAKLDEALKAIGDRVTSIKIWLPDGTIVYSPLEHMVGRRFPVTSSMHRALAGSIAAELDGEPHEGDEHDHELRGSVIEVYAPVRGMGTDRVVAVAEYYSRQPRLAGELRWAAASSWLVVASVALTMISALYGIVRNGSRIIDEQRSSLQAQIRELQALLQQNQELRLSVQRAHHRSVAINERQLRRIGSDLHDGPAQLLSLALLQIDGLRATPAAEPQAAARRNSAADHLVRVLADALADIRAISSGLVLPDIERLDLEQVLRRAAQTHAFRTGTEVAFDLDVAAAGPLPPALKVCAYRLVQEGLNNAFRHAGGQGQTVGARANLGRLSIEVSDQGPGLRGAEAGGKNEGLGLVGLRDRVETLGGRMTFACTQQGCALSAVFDLEAAQLADIGHV